MLSECGQNKDYIRAVICKGEGYSAESLFMLLVLQQGILGAIVGDLDLSGECNAISNTFHTVDCEIG